MENENPFARLGKALKRWDAAKASYERQRDLFAAADADFTEADRELCAAKDEIGRASAERAATA